MQGVLARLNWSALSVVHLSLMDRGPISGHVISVSDLLRAPDLESFIFGSGRVIFTGLENVTAEMMNDKYWDIEIYSKAPFSAEEASLLGDLKFNVGCCAHGPYSRYDLPGAHLWMAKN